MIKNPRQGKKEISSTEEAELPSNHHRQKRKTDPGSSGCVEPKRESATERKADGRKEKTLLHEKKRVPKRGESPRGNC